VFTRLVEMKSTPGKSQELADLIDAKAVPILKHCYLIWPCQNGDGQVPFGHAAFICGESQGCVVTSSRMATRKV
jgi:hypothetical protein